MRSIRWPGVTRPGSVSDSPVITMDLFPTVLEACGIPLPTATTATGAAGRDGLSLVPLLRGNAGAGHAELFWHYPHHQHYQLGGAMPYSAVRSGDFTLIEFHDGPHVELYDLRADIGQSRDLAASHPEKAAQLRARLHAWRSEVAAQMPVPNLHYDSARPQYDPSRPQPPPGQRPGR